MVAGSRYGGMGKDLTRKVNIKLEQLRWKKVKANYNVNDKDFQSFG
jgi:hypothetical protein